MAVIIKPVPAPTFTVKRKGGWPKGRPRKPVQDAGVIPTPLSPVSDGPKVEAAPLDPMAEMARIEREMMAVAPEKPPAQSNPDDKGSPAPPPTPPAPGPDGQPPKVKYTRPVIKGSIFKFAGDRLGSWADARGKEGARYRLGDKEADDMAEMLADVLEFYQKSFNPLWLFAFAMFAWVGIPLLSDLGVMDKLKGVIGEKFGKGKESEKAPPAPALPPAQPPQPVTQAPAPPPDARPLLERMVKPGG